MSDLAALQAERREILASWAYAFAMGHGCSLGARDPRAEDVLVRLRDVSAMIEECS